jgi:hypothetical protein
MRFWMPVIGFLAIMPLAAAAGSDQDFDMACAVTSAAEIATNPRDSEAGRLAFVLNVFFLGRMSGRDSKTLWSAVVKGRVAELRDRSKSSEMYGRCLDFVTKQL